jgi:hypothetical protein
METRTIKKAAHKLDDRDGYNNTVVGTTDTTYSTTNPEKNTDAPRDFFERLVNTPGVGTLKEIATAMDDITLTRGFMADIDPYHFREGGPLGIQAGLSPLEFYEKHLRNWQQRSPFWKNAEVLCTGNGLAFVHRLCEPVLLRDATDVQRFDLLVKITHTSLPADPDQGGICQMPRVPGSLNTKHGKDRPVVLLSEGSPIPYSQFNEFANRMFVEPMTVILETLFGGKRICPCPFCRRSDSQLTPSHRGRSAKCNRCREFSMGKFYSSILKDREPINQEEGGEL